MPLVLFFNLYVLRKLCCFGVLLEEEHVDHTDEDSGRNDDADNVCLADKDVAELVYHEGDAVCKAALISDCEPCPLSVVHLTLVLVTADHETGGITYNEETGEYYYTTKSHTGVNVPVYVSASDAGFITGEAYDNYCISTQLARVMGYDKSQFPKTK